MPKKIKKEKRFSAKNILMAIGMVLLVSALTMFSREIGGSLGEYFGKKNSNAINKENTDITYNIKPISSSEEYGAKNYSILLLINNNCSLCEEQAQTINKITNEHKLSGYYINIDEKVLLETDKWFLENTILPEEIDEFPITMLYKNGEFVFAIEGYKDKSVIESFLETNEITK